MRLNANGLSKVDVDGVRKKIMNELGLCATRVF